MHYISVEISPYTSDALIVAIFLSQFRNRYMSRFQIVFHYSLQNPCWCFIQLTFSPSFLNDSGLIAFTLLLYLFTIRFDNPNFAATSNCFNPALGMFTISNLIASLTFLQSFTDTQGEYWFRVYHDYGYIWLKNQGFYCRSITHSDGILVLTLLCPLPVLRFLLE